MNLKLSLQYNNQGRTADTDYNQHIRNLVEQVLFTSPGERVNRPNFGSGLLQMVFTPNSSELAATTQFLVQSSLNQWLGNLIAVNEVRVTSLHERLEIMVSYTILKTQEIQVAQFSR